MRSARLTPTSRPIGETTRTIGIATATPVHCHPLLDSGLSYPNKASQEAGRGLAFPDPVLTGCRARNLLRTIANHQMLEAVGANEIFEAAERDDANFLTRILQADTQCNEWWTSPRDLMASKSTRISSVLSCSRPGIDAELGRLHRLWVSLIQLKTPDQLALNKTSTSTESVSKPRVMPFGNSGNSAPS